MLKIGNVAPAFSLKDQNGNTVSLKDFKGKKMVVLYFYPKAMTPGCTVQACGIRDSQKLYAKKNIIVLGVSPDSPERLTKFVEKEKLNFTLLSDPDHTIAKKYEVFGPKKFMGKEYLGIHRVTFIIGKDGKLKAIMDKVKTKTHHDDVLEIIEQL